MIKYVIMDVHGQIDLYRSMLNGLDGDSIQLGDFGFGFEKIDPIIPKESFDCNGYQHRVGEGNHDCHIIAKHHPSILPRFGLIQNDPSVFWVSGAHTPPELYPIREGINWWRTEELSYLEQQECFDQYINCKPEIVISHDGPYEITKLLLAQEGKVVRYSATTNLLQKMLDYHPPKLWVFGHYHTRFTISTEHTKFVCGQILDVYDIDMGNFI